MSQLFASGHQSITALASILPMSIQGWFLLGLTNLILLQSKDSQDLLQYHSTKASILQCPASLWSNSHSYMTTGKTVILTLQTFVNRWCLCFLVCCLGLSQLSSKEQASLNFMAAITVCSDFRAQENKICHCFHFPPSICHEVMEPDAMVLLFLMLSFQPAISLSSFTLFKNLLSSSSPSAIRVVTSAYQRLLIFLPAKSIPACDSSQATWFPPYS